MPELGLGRVNGALYAFSAECEAQIQPRRRAVAAFFAERLSGLQCLAHSGRHTATRHAPHHLLHAALRHFFHHFFHLKMLLQEPINVLNLYTRTQCYALFPGSINSFWKTPFAERH